MTRIASTFATLREHNEAALIAFLMAGDPDLETTLQLCLAVAETGADIIELGVPFSDPTADGPVLQRSAERSLRHGASLPRVLGLVQRFREQSQVPIILFGYYNPIFRYGPERFAADAARAGADGCLVVDLPPEEADELQPHTDAADLDLIFLLAPTSGPERVRRVTKRARGFVYYVSLTGVTGARAVLPEGLGPAVTELRRVSPVPVGVGFGISQPEQAATVARFADGVVVGSAIMKIVEEHSADGTAVDRVAEFVQSLKKAIQTARPHTEAAR